MALTTTSEIVTALAIKNTSAENLARIDLIRTQVEAAVKSFVKWGIEAVTGQVDYHDGNGYLDIALRQPFISAVTEVKTDQTGAYGNGPSAFAAAALTNGEDYVLKKEGSLGKSGMLRRLANSAYWWPSDRIVAGRGGLSYYSGPYWPLGIGNVKVTYNYGFSTIPDDIKLAVETAMALILKSVKTGGLVSTESLGDYNYSLSTGLARDSVFGDVRQLLANYRDGTI